MVKKTSALAMTGLILGTSSLVLSWVPILNNLAAGGAVLGGILGLLGIYATRQRGPRRGRAKAASAVAISVLAFILVLWTQRIYGETIESIAGDVPTPPRATSSTPSAVAWGTAARLEDDVSVTCSRPSAFVRAPYGVGGDGMPLFRKSTCRVTNRGTVEFDPTMITVGMSAGGTEGAQVFQNGLTSLLNPILPGRSASWTPGFGIVAPDRVQLTIRTFGHQITFYNPKEK